MKLHLLLFTSIVLLAGCTPEERAERREHIVQPPEKNSIWDLPTESYSGFVKGTEVVFEHLNYTRYRLKLDDEITEGELNTERGFGDDANATLYILNHDRPESEHAYFVRYSNGDLVMLDPDRKPLEKARFTKHIP